jgi:diguanylate cyclase (GGDEF)-like protein/putative nucleotidyltransferase with HDIG domain
MAIRRRRVHGGRKHGTLPGVSGRPRAGTGRRLPAWAGGLLCAGAGLIALVAVALPGAVPAWPVVLAGVLALAGGAILLADLRARPGSDASAREQLEQQSSLRRVATAVAAGAPPEGIFALVTSEAGRLLGADAAAVARFEVGGAHAMVLGTWAAPGGAAQARIGRVHRLSRAEPLGALRLAGGPVITEAGAGGEQEVLGLRYRSLLVAPVHTGAKVWGAVVAAASAPAAFGDLAAERVQEYADLIATAIANAEDRVLLQRQAGRDPLTDLLNRRAFSERLAEEVGRAQRHGRPLSVGVVDVDRFRELNDRVGAEAADAALVEVALRVRERVRDEDVVARLVADRLGVIFVESDPDEAQAAAERARASVATLPLRHGVVATVSIGLCDLEHAAMAEDLLRRASAAVERVKADGGDGVRRYAPPEALPAGARVADVLDRSHALLGLRALARAIDAKDPATREHSERVAALAARLAAVRGWPDEATARLREAALLHDVGKIGVPDEILLKRGALTSSERAVVEEHAALGAHIVAGVLEDDQAEWIGGHHERPDGRGYPERLRASDIPEGASLLALADAWDVMTGSSWYAPRRSVAEALDEVRGVTGAQFSPDAVAALDELNDRGELTLAAARLRVA